MDKKEKAEQNGAKGRYGSFYLRVGAVAFGIGSMVYSGLEFGQYFELKGDLNINWINEFALKIKLATHSIVAGESRCQNFLIALTPAARMVLSIVQMQFIFLNTKEFEMQRNRIIVRFGLMHMVGTNLCEWLYVLVEETKHEIVNLAHKQQLLGSLVLSLISPRLILINFFCSRLLQRSRCTDCSEFNCNWRSRDC